jgi:CO/xanthine dehydrogenase FAD-binding subunit
LDLNTVETIVTRPTRAMLSGWSQGDAWLAGGSWIFSEPQPHLRRLLDLQGFGWTSLDAGPEGLTVAATCRIADLQAWGAAPAEWIGAGVIEQCCRALLGSFKVWNVATVGGNMCLALPAGPMTSLAVALEGRCVIWGADTERTVPALDFVRGERATVLQPGEILRALVLPAAALRRRTAFRQISLSPLGRSGALLIGTLDRDGAFALTVTASTVRPFRFSFDTMPSLDAVHAAIAAGIPPTAWHDDIHGRPDWRRHVTGVLAAAIHDELGTGGA